MRGFFAYLALRCAEAALRHSESVLGMADKRRHLERSEFWHDVSAWLDGLETWSELRWLRRRRLSQQPRTSDPDAPLRIPPKPRTGMGSGEAKAWLLIWFGVLALTISSFVIGPHAWVF